MNHSIKNLPTRSLLYSFTLLLTGCSTIERNKAKEQESQTIDTKRNEAFEDLSVSLDTSLTNLNNAVIQAKKIAAAACLAAFQAQSSRSAAMKVVKTIKKRHRRARFTSIDTDAFLNHVAVKAITDKPVKKALASLMAAQAVRKAIDDANKTEQAAKVAAKVAEKAMKKAINDADKAAQAAKMAAQAAEVIVRTAEAIPTGHAADLAKVYRGVADVIYATSVICKLVKRTITITATYKGSPTSFIAVYTADNRAISAAKTAHLAVESTDAIKCNKIYAMGNKSNRHLKKKEQKHTALKSNIKALREKYKNR